MNNEIFPITLERSLSSNFVSTTTISIDYDFANTSNEYWATSDELNMPNKPRNQINRIYNYYYVMSIERSAFSSTHTVVQSSTYRKIVHIINAQIGNVQVRGN